MNLEDQVRKHKEISLKIEQLEEQKRALGQTIMQAMTDKTLQVGPFLVRHCSRLSISTTTEQARAYGAIKLEEVVDKEKIKTLYKSGTPLPGIKEVEYIQITSKDHQDIR